METISVSNTEWVSWYTWFCGTTGHFFDAGEREIWRRELLRQNLDLSYDTAGRLITQMRRDERITKWDYPVIERAFRNNQQQPTTPPPQHWGPAMTAEEYEQQVAKWESNPPNQWMANWLRDKRQRDAVPEPAQQPSETMAERMQAEIKDATERRTETIDAKPLGDLVGKWTPPEPPAEGDEIPF